MGDEQFGCRVIIQIIIEIEIRHAWQFVVAHNKAQGLLFDCPWRRKAAAVEHTNDRALLAKP
jgi:hypothetical protein